MPHLFFLRRARVLSCKIEQISQRSYSKKYENVVVLHIIGLVTYVVRGFLSYRPFPPPQPEAPLVRPRPRPGGDAPRLRQQGDARDPDGPRADTPVQGRPVQRRQDGGGRRRSRAQGNLAEEHRAGHTDGDEARGLIEKEHKYIYILLLQTAGIFGNSSPPTAGARWVHRLMI